ncbi:MAG: N-6 DNA methylase, partial [Bacteroidota bacterium]
MKYQAGTTVVPQEKREGLNKKILDVIRLKPEALKAGDVYSLYTGIGGLHGLSRADYGSYHAFAKDKKEVEQGQFFTPHHVAEFVTTLVPASISDVVLDPTCGVGSFFNFCPIESNCYGNELEKGAHTVGSFLYPEANITVGDIRVYTPPKATLIYGNPPFNLRWDGEKSQHVFVKYCHEWLVDGGFLAMVVPASYLSGSVQENKHVEAIQEMFDFVCQVSVP